MKIPIKIEECVALGAETNNVICVGKEGKCTFSEKIVDCTKSSDFLKETVANMIKNAEITPKKIICDMHPGYSTNEYGKELAKQYGIDLIQIQHHKAHVASVAGEYGIKDCVGIAIDGLGYGEDGTIWGGEVFDVDNYSQINRVGHLETQKQMGDTASMHPNKMLIGILTKFCELKRVQELELYSNNETKLLYNAIKNNFNTVKSTSVGRVLDAVSALLGVCNRRNFEGQPAIELEQFASSPYDFDPVINKQDDKEILMTTPLFKFILKNFGKDKKRLAATAQMYIAKGLYKIAAGIAKGKPIVVAGGVVYNKMISGYLKEKGVLMNKDISCGDGGICYGQIILGNLL